MVSREYNVSTLFITDEELERKFHKCSDEQLRRTIHMYSSWMERNLTTHPMYAMALREVEMRRRELSRRDILIKVS